MSSYFSYHWKDLSIAEIAVYVIITAFSLYPAFRLIFTHRSTFKWFYARYYILMLTKITAGITSTVFLYQADGKSNINVGLLVASTTLNSITLGFTVALYDFTLNFVNNFYATEKVKVKGLLFGPVKQFLAGEITAFQLSESFSDKIALIAVILTAVGSGKSGDTDPNNRRTIKSLLEAASILFLITVLGSTVRAIFKLRQVLSLKGPHKTQISSVLIILIFSSFPLTVRVIYNICAAFTYNVNGTYTTNVTKFSFLFGDWKLYAFLGLLQETITVLLITAITWIVSWTESTRTRYARGFKENESYRLESE